LVDNVALGEATAALSFTCLLYHAFVETAMVKRFGMLSAILLS